ncbi:DUF3486 family protein [Ideonella dechloratans]|uniref:DUF3486 family protein n=1 Tax=Ideonella dechloratans TaxID=36863 RepID=UPI0035B28F4E
MGRRSTVSRFPEPIVTQVNQLIRDGHTIDEIVATLQRMGADVSRSAMGRYVKSARESMEKYRQAQEVAKVWVDKLETEPSGDVARLLPEMLRAVAFQTLSTMGEATDPVGSQDLMFLAKALKDVSSASRINVDTELLLRKVRDQAKAAAAEVTKTIKQAGLSDETVQQIKARILGIGAAQ